MPGKLTRCGKPSASPGGYTATNIDKPASNAAGVSRRFALRAIGSGAAISHGAAAVERRAKILALAGDRYHNIDYIRTSLRKTIERDLGIGIDFTNEPGAVSAKALSNYELLIVFRDGVNWPNGYDDDDPPHIEGRFASEPPLPHWQAKPEPWITAAQGAAIKDFVQRGNGALFYHCAPFISPYSADFRDVLGAITEEHPPIRPFKVKIVNRSHPITEGVSDFVVTDEQHFVKYEKDPRGILLESVNEDGLTWKNLGVSSPAGWALDYGRGRVCYLAPGHLMTALWNPEYEKIQRNAVKWLLRSVR